MLQTIIDTHVHLIEPDRFHYPWLESVPSLHGSWTLEEWMPDDDLAGRAYGLFMEVDVAEEDASSEASHFCRVAEDESTPMIGVIASCRPEKAGFFDFVDRIDHPRLIGLRRVLHVAPEGTMASETFVGNLRRLWTRNLPFDLCVRADQLRDAMALIDQCPNTQFVLDHAGNPPLGTEEMIQWRSDIEQLAKRPNLACKLSGLVNHLEHESASTAPIHRVFAHAAECFGPNRLLFGGDWPVCTLAGYGMDEWVELALEITSAWTTGDRNAFFADNAERIYGHESLLD